MRSNQRLPSFMIGVLWVCFLFTRALGEGIPKPPVALFVLFVGLILVKCCRKVETVNKILFYCLIYILLSLIILSPPSIFQPYTRYLYFALSLLVSSSLIQSDKLRKFRRTAFTIILNISVLVTIISFICYFMGINLVVREYDDADSYLENPNLFAGITSHSMILGFISMMAFVYTSYLALKKRKFIIWAVAIICFVTCIFSASRAALLSGLVSFLYLIVRFSNDIWQILKRLVLVLLVISLATPIWERYVDRVMEKQEMRGDLGIFDSRTEKVEARWKEFKESPIIGIGFSTIDTNYDRIKKNGAIEPGSSWLGILSMTGIVGFFFFLCYFIHSWYIVHKGNHYLYEVLIFVLAIHMIFEGYVFSAGSLQCIVLWTILGASHDQSLLEH